MGEKFKLGDTVYHKATGEKGVISGRRWKKWIVAWKSGKKSAHSEAELLTAEEHEKKIIKPQTAKSLWPRKKS